MSQSLSIDEIFRKVQSIPPLPQAVQRISTLTQNLESDSNELAQIIASDEVLTGKILRIANSAFYGLSQKVSTVPQAIVIIGQQGVRSLALGVTVFGFGSRTEEKIKTWRTQLWKHSLAVGSAMRELASLTHADPELAFVCGLMHDLGKVLFMEFYPDLYKDILEKAASGEQCLHEIEESVFGLHHGTAGSELCRHWKIPTSITKVLASHHLPRSAIAGSSEDDHRISLARVSDQLARIAQIGSDGESHVEKDFLTILQREGVSIPMSRRVLLSLPREVEKAEVFFELAPSPTHPLPPSIRDTAVFLADPVDREIVQMTLLSLGHAPMIPDEITGAETHFVAVIADGSLSPEKRATFEQRGVLVLNFDAWREASEAPLADSQLNIHSLQVWLQSKLPANGSPSP